MVKKIMITLKVEDEAKEKEGKEEEKGGLCGRGEGGSMSQDLLKNKESLSLSS